MIIFWILSEQKYRKVMMTFMADVSVPVQNEMLLYTSITLETSTPSNSEVPIVPRSDIWMVLEPWESPRTG